MRERRLPISSKCLLAPGLWIPLPFTLALGLLACGPSVRDFGDTSSSSSTGSGSGGSGSVGEGGAGGGGVDLGKGPKLVKSDPPNGDTQASIQQYFTLFFDRPVSSVNATGKIKVASDAHPEPSFVQVGPCPDNANDPTCIAAAYPDAVLDMDPNNGTSGRHLPSNTKVTVTIDKTFKDTDGNVNNLDTTLSFTTFKYKLSVVDDSKAITDEAGGLDYDPKSQALFVCGSEQVTGTLIVRKIGISVDGGVSASPSTFYQQGSLPGGNLCYGLDIAEGQAYVSATYANQVWVLKGLTASGTKPAQTLSMTTLPAPNVTLDQVKSVAAFSQGNTMLFGFGRYLGNGTAVSGILSYNTKMGWSVWQKLDTPSEGFTVAPATDATGTYVYVALKDRILKIDLSKSVVNTHMLPAGSFFYEPQMRVDTQGRLYFGGDNGGLTVYDTSGAKGFKVLAKRDGLPMGRFGIRENGKDVDVFFMRFRDKAVIGSTTISF